MPKRSYRAAINDAIRLEMERDPNVLTFGEDVGYFGGVFKVTEHLQTKYGKKRCFDAPINENGIATLTGHPFVTAPNKFEALSAHDAMVDVTSTAL